MMKRAWKVSLRRFAELLGIGMVLYAAPAWACADGPTIEEETTFDPSVAGTSEAQLFYDPNVIGFGGPCETCAKDEMRTDWEGYLGPGINIGEWMIVLLSAELPDIDGMIFSLQGKPAKLAGGFARSTVIGNDPSSKEKRIAALYFVGFARRAEQARATNPKSSSASAALLTAGMQALARAPDDFLKQRYAFQLVRLLFYRGDYARLEGFIKDNDKALSGPSQSLRWRAQYYLAGALRRSEKRPQSNLLLARIHAGFPPLAAQTAEDFQPMEASDWATTLALATNGEEKTLLWRLVGLRQDGVTAIKEILAIDPRSALVPLLLVREVDRLESEPQKGKELEPLVQRIETTKDAPQNWVAYLVGAHVSALHGDAPVSLAQLGTAIALRLQDPAVLHQGQATLAIALAKSWTKSDAALEERIAKAVANIDPKFSRAASVISLVGSTLGKKLGPAGRTAEAELLTPGEGYWTDPNLVKEMAERVHSPKTAFDHFVAAGHDEGALLRELAMSHLVKGDYDDAAQVFEKGGAASENLGTDPFVIHIKDCHDCDHEKYGPSSKWTHASFVRRMAALHREAASAGEKGAQAALLFANGLYNITDYGNARSVLADTHFVTVDTALAQVWYGKAFEKSQEKEFKAKAAFMAAKSELAQMLEKAGRGHYSYGHENEPLPVPETWFSALRGLGKTRYQDEVLAECGNYASWKGRSDLKEMIDTGKGK